MNKIVIANDEIVLKQNDKTIKIDSLKKNDFLHVKLIKIDVLEDTSLVIEASNNKETKFEININVKENVSFNLYEIKENGTYKFYYDYTLEKHSSVNVFKVYDVSTLKEQIKINLNGEKARIMHMLKTISKDEEKYDFLVYHNAKETYSNVINHGANIRKGLLTFNLSGFAPNGITDCDINQNSRIINLTNNKCEIKPNLFIDENDINASHSALIGTFSNDEMFYLMSRGINKNKAENLLIKGFLLNGVDYFKKDLEKIINKYWR